MPAPGGLSAAEAERRFARAVALHQGGDHAGADKALHPLARAFPDHPDVCHLLGVVRLALKRPTDAIAPLRAALALAERTRPDILPGVCTALGSALRGAGRLDDAVDAFRRAAALSPGNADVHFNLGNVLGDLRRRPEAAAAYAVARRLAPGDADIAFALGETLVHCGDRDGAMAAYRATVALAPNHARAWAALGGLALDRQDFAAVRDALDRSLALDPDLAEAHVNRGLLLTLIGDADGAIATTTRALALNPTLAIAHSNLIYQMHYSARHSAAAILAEARRWNAAHAAPLAPRARPPANARDPDKRLRVGYIGGDFRAHPVGYFMLALFLAHDPGRVESFVYMTDTRTDAVSEELRAAVGHWRDAAASDAASLAETIRADGIDILVDVAGHTARNRLLALAEKPAPVQAVGGGLTGTTGMDAIDYIIADRFEIPPGHEKFHSESVVRLPGDYICYAPPDAAPAVAALPALALGRVAFGCFNAAAKITPQAVALWARVLKAVSGSRMVLKSFGFGVPECRERFTRLFAEHGVGADRLILEGPAPHAELLAAYGRVDIALDPLPYSGGLTTLESLWMGVPVVTLPGETFASRHSASHLANAGLPELVAGDADDYVAIATRLAGDKGALADLRARLRPRLAASPICDGAGYALGLETAYRTMWRRWVAGEKPRGFDVSA